MASNLSTIEATINESQAARSINLNPSVSVETGAPIRCTHVISQLKTGGAELLLQRLVSGMDKDRFQHNVVSLSETSGEVASQIVHAGINIQSLRMHHDPISVIKAIFKLAYLLKKNDTALVQTWMYHSDFVGLLAARLAGIQCVIWNIRCAITEFPDRPWTKRLLHLNAKLSNMPSAIIVNSHAGLKLHSELGYASSRMTVIPNGFDTDRFCPNLERRKKVRSELGISDDSFVIGVIANWSPFKGFDYFFDAANQFAAQRGNVRFVLIGSGLASSNEQLRKLVDQSLWPSLILLGHRDDVPDLMNGFDMLSMNSITEGFPNVVGEAMSCGVPCVVTDVGDTAQMVGDTGIAVSANSAASLVKGWNQILSLSNDQRKAMGRRARERILSLYYMKKMINCYEKLYLRAVHPI